MMFVFCQVTLMCWGGSGGVVSSGGGVVLLPVACLCTVEKKLKEVFSTGGKTRDPRSNRTRPASELPWNLRRLSEFHLSDVGFELPHHKNLFLASSSPVLSCLPNCETGSPVDSSPSPLQHFPTRPCSVWWIFHRAEETALLLLAGPILRLGPSSRYLSPSETIVSVCLGREWWAYHIRRKRSVYSPKSYTVSFSSGIQGRPGFHLRNNNNNHGRGPHYQLIDWW